MQLSDEELCNTWRISLCTILVTSWAIIMSLHQSWKIPQITTQCKSVHVARSQWWVWVPSSDTTVWYRTPKHSINFPENHLDGKKRTPKNPPKASLLIQDAGQYITLGSLPPSQYLPPLPPYVPGFLVHHTSYQDIRFSFYGLCCCPCSLAACTRPWSTCF